MLKKRIIPILLFDGDYCVQTIRFNRPPRRLGPIEQYVRNMANRNIDELILLDITATEQKREPDFKRIKEFTNELFCPVTYGGGIASIDHISKLIQECGVDKVSIRSNFNKLIEPSVVKFGSQAIIFSMDCFPPNSSGTYLTEILKITLIEHVQKLGVGEIFLTCVKHQGRQLGYNYILVNQVSEYCKVPLIANGGCGSVEHMRSAIEAGADAVAASTVFALTGLTPQDASRGLQEAGIETRVETLAPVKDRAAAPQSGMRRGDV